MAFQRLLAHGGFLRYLHDMQYANRFSDEQIVEALKQAAAQGVSRDVAGDKIQPPNLCAFYNNLPRPERDRLLTLAFGERAGGE